MNWRWLKAFPKFALVLILIVGSTVAFRAWWFVHSWKKALYGGHPIAVENNAPKIAQIEANWDRLLLVDNDLYDLKSGQVIFKDWLENKMPEKLFWEPESKTVLAQYERGYVRYGLDGKKKVALMLKHQFAISNDSKWIVFAKEQDIWRADVDWKELTLRNERKMTSIAQFNDQNFADNIILGTDKTLVVRNMNQILRVNLETGEVHPTRIPLNGYAKRRSPDDKSMVGVEGSEFYCYDLDSDTTKTLPVGRGNFNDWQWLDNDRCAVIAAGTAVVLYDRSKHSLTKIVTLPFFCQKIGNPSPHGRYVFCIGGKVGVLVDFEKKTSAPIAGGAGVSWISNDTFAFSREVPDSALRGTWLQTAGDDERRVSSEPYLVDKAGGFILSTSSPAIVFATKEGLSQMAQAGGHITQVVKLPRSPERALAFQRWQ